LSEGASNGRLEQVVDVFRRAAGIVERALVVGVGGAHVDEIRFGPRHHEDGATVLGDRNDGGNVGRQAMRRQRDVDSFGGTNGARVRSFVEGPHIIGPDAGGVDDDPGLDRDVGRGIGGIGANDRSVRRPVVGGGEADHRGVVGHDGAVVERRRTGHGEGQAGIVGPRVEVEEPGHEMVGVERRQVGQGLGFGDPFVTGADAQTAGDVVEPQGNGVRAGHRLGDHPVPAEEGDQEG
jgi:hypothetical protein